MGNNGVVPIGRRFQTTAALRSEANRGESRDRLLRPALAPACSQDPTEASGRWVTIAISHWREPEPRVSHRQNYGRCGLAAVGYAYSYFVKSDGHALG